MSPSVCPLASVPSQFLFVFLFFFFIDGAFMDRV